MTRTSWKTSALIAEIWAQITWIREHGRTLGGYVARYGSVSDDVHYGNGGEAIYEADKNYLAGLIEIAKKRKIDTKPFNV